MRARSLKRTILVTFISACFLCCVLIFFISVHYSRKEVRNIVRDDIVVMADRCDDIIGEVIFEKFSFLEYTAALPILKSDEYSLLQKMAIISPMAKDKSKNLMSISYIDKSGDAYIGPNTKMNFMTSPLVKQVLTTKKTALFGPSADNVTGELSINIGAPVFDNNNEITGMLLARLDCKFLCEISSRIRMGQTGYAIFIDRATGNTIGAPQEEDVRNNQNLLDIAVKNNMSELESNMRRLLNGETDCGSFTVNDTTRYIAFKPIANTNWSVAVMADEAEYIGKLHTMENIMFTITAILIIASLIAAFYITRNLTPLKMVGDAISEIATGNADLTQRLKIKHSKKEIIEIVDGFNKFVEKLQQIITSMKSSENNLVLADNSLQAGTQDTAAAITQIIANIQSVNNQITNQADSVEETAGAVNEIASNITSLEHMIQKQSEGVTQASTAVEEMIGNINSVNNSVDTMFSSFKELEQNTNAGIKTQSDVNEIIKQIEDQSKMLQDANTAIASIASQTNLLAMNAAIEAAHAGESGKGFSVVADEIRKLSETSTNQSKSIGEELKHIQESINSVVHASSEATTVFTSVSNSIKNTDELVRHIKAAMEEQQIGSKQITDALYAMNDSTLEVKSASAEMAEGNKHILAQINKLQDVTSMIKESITEMSSGAQKINATGAALSEVSKEVTDSIESIKSEIDLFKV